MCCDNAIAVLQSNKGLLYCILTRHSRSLYKYDSVMHCRDAAIFFLASPGSVNA